MNFPSWFDRTRSHGSTRCSDVRAKWNGSTCARFGFALAAILLMLSHTIPASAQGSALYRYVDAQGKVHYSDRPPTEATGRAMDKISRQGTILKRYEAALTPEEIVQRDLERKKEAEREKQRIAQMRRELALLTTYRNEREIRDAREIALGAPREVLVETESRLAETEQHRGKLGEEVAALNGERMPRELRDAIRTTDLEIGALKTVIDAKQREIDIVNKRFDEERRRYLEIMLAREAMLGRSALATYRRP